MRARDVTLVVGLVALAGAGGWAARGIFAPSRQRADEPSVRPDVVTKAPRPAKPIASASIGAKTSKADVARTLLAKGDVFINLDPRRDGVVLPAKLRTSPRLVLQYGTDLPVPIPDLAIRDDGVAATLSFDRTPFVTFVPWSAVFAIVDASQHGMMWREDFPPEIALDAGP